MSNPEPNRSSLPRLIRYVTAAIVLLTLALGLVAILRPLPGTGPDAPGLADGETQEDAFLRWANTGKNLIEQGNAAKAVEAFAEALQLRPNDTNALANLAVAELMNNQPEPALEHAQRALAIAPTWATALYIAGCAHVRLGQWTNAIQRLQETKQIDRTVNPVSFQLGRAYQQSQQWELALEQFQEVVQFEPAHPAAYYNLSQVLRQLGRKEEAQTALAAHQELQRQQENQITNPFEFERCAYTAVQVPFRLEQPDPNGIPVRFVHATAEVWPSDSASFLGPVGVLDLQHDGWPELVVRENSAGFRLLFNSNGVFHPSPDLLPIQSNTTYISSAVGDLNNDGVEDVLMLGPDGSQLYKFSTNGQANDLSLFSRARTIRAHGGVLADLDFTGKLDLISFGEDGLPLQTHRNLGQPYFIDATTNSGLPLTLTGVLDAAVADWNGDDLLDVFVATGQAPPMIFLRERGGPLIPTNAPPDWPVASALAVADLNNDLRPDLVTAHENTVTVHRQGFDTPWSWQVQDLQVSGIRLVDFDNDGWLDIAAHGRATQVWRNLGEAGFTNVTSQLGLDDLGPSTVIDLVAADFDLDGDSDWLATMEDQSLQFWRNEGGNAHRQLKLHLMGRKSNFSGLGIEVEIRAGNLRLSRRIQSLPIEIGVGANERIDSLIAHWFDFDVATTDIPVDPLNPLPFIELQVRDGSCPYLYVWDGNRYRFVSDILGSAPLGLPINASRLVESFPYEYVSLGGEQTVGTAQGNVSVQITEELREVLYLDEATLVVADHEPGTEIHPTSKLMPGAPFPEPGLVTLHRPYPLLGATLHGRDVSDRLRHIDARFVSPRQWREPQLRGLVEPFQIEFTVEPLDPSRPLVLALTGWLRYGGGSVNIGASHRSDLPFPFPVLEVRHADGTWQSVDATVGAPAGNTKTILVDLQHKLPTGSRQFRLRTAYEIHWDRIAFWERSLDPLTRFHRVAPSQTDLHWRGYSEYLDLPSDQPLTPDYDRVRDIPPWRITPSGWATAYGPVDDLIAGTDNALALVCGGDELCVTFAVSDLPATPEGWQRNFFIYLVGWDKDADFHVRTGSWIDPIPWHGMDAQQYGRQTRPGLANDGWMERTLTRWVGPRPMARRGLRPETLR